MARTSNSYLGKVRIPYYDGALHNGAELDQLYTTGLFWFKSQEDYEKHRSLNFLKIIEDMEEWLVGEFTRRHNICLCSDRYAIGEDGPPIIDYKGDQKEKRLSHIPAFEEGGYYVSLKIVLRQRPSDQPPYRTLFTGHGVMHDNHPTISEEQSFLFRDHNDWKKHEDDGYEQLYGICLKELLADKLKFKAHLISGITCILTNKVCGYYSTRPRLDCNIYRLATVIPYYQDPCSNKRLPVSTVQISPYKRQHALPPNERCPPNCPQKHVGDCNL